MSEKKIENNNEKKKKHVDSIKRKRHTEKNI